MINWREKIIPLHFKEHLQKTNGHLWKYGLFIPINVLQCSLQVTQLTTHLCFLAAIPSSLSCHHQKTSAPPQPDQKPTQVCGTEPPKGQSLHSIGFFSKSTFFLKVLNYIQPNSTLKTFSNPLCPILLPCFCDFIHLALYTYLPAILWWGFCTLSFAPAWWNQPYKPTAITNNRCAPVLRLGRTEQGVQNTILKEVHIQAQKKTKPERKENGGQHKQKQVNAISNIKCSKLKKRQISYPFIPNSLKISPF